MSGREFADWWRDDKFLQEFHGLGMINIYEYFARSPFCDKKSINGRLLQQGISFDTHPELGRHHTGTEYHNEMPHPGLFVIREYHRSSPSDAELRLLRVFYVLDSTVYLAPRLSALFRARLSKIQHHLAAVMGQYIAAADEMAKAEGPVEDEVCVVDTAGAGEEDVFTF